MGKKRNSKSKTNEDSNEPSESSPTKRSRTDEPKEPDDNIDKKEDDLAIETQNGAKEKKARSKKRKKKRCKKSEEEGSSAVNDEPSESSPIKRPRTDDPKEPDDIDKKEDDLAVETSKKRKKKKRNKSEKEGNSVINNEIVKDNDDQDKPSLTLLLNAFFGPRGERPKKSRLKMADVQQMILFSVLGGAIHQSPNWCNMALYSRLKKTVFILLSAIGYSDYSDNQDCFPFITKQFSLIAPTNANGSEFGFEFPHNNLLSVPLSQKDKRKKNYERNQRLLSKGEPQNREEYMMTKDQFEANDYPSMCSYDGLVPFCTADKPSNDSNQPYPLFAIDCEMCKTSEGQELTRVSIVDESANVLYDSLVQPNRPILDYLTKYSGITAEKLNGITVKLKDVQQEIQRLLPPAAIIIGHSLEFDFRALKMYHTRVIDTSVIYGDARGSQFKPALRHLARVYLKKDIQDRSGGHCSIEDAKTCMELVKLKLENGPCFGLPAQDKESLFERLTRANKQCSMIDSPGIVRPHSSGGHHAIPCTNDAEVVKCASSQITKSDFTWIHLHSLETFYKENIKQEKDDIGAGDAFEATLREVDSHVCSIFQSIPEDCLVMVLMGHSDIRNVLKLQKNREPMMEQLKQEVQEAKRGLCFFKIT